jgi:hypothetical protein
MVAHQEERKISREKNLARRGAFSKAEERRKNLQKDSPSPKYNIISPPNSTPDKEETSAEEIPLEMNEKIEQYVNWNQKSKENTLETVN